MTPMFGSVRYYPYLCITIMGSGSVGGSMRYHRRGYTPTCFIVSQSLGQGGVYSVPPIDECYNTKVPLFFDMAK